ncbi:MAG TPA: tRNA epoxyqueuosine(34) reductase QueG [Gemmatimonadales bacterium]|nr:tRNA epoxyqueuosine(34) reductase QueG [Gemmatimonadales bacterium]
MKRRAAALGFSATGIATLEPSRYQTELDRWLAAGRAGTMSYVARQAPQRKEPATILPGATVAVVTLTNYHHRDDRDTAPRVAQYAWSKDYHAVLKPRLAELAREITTPVPGASTRCYVDAGPVPERELAQRAGLGWIGNNTLLINPRLGSFTFIGVVLTDAALAPDLPFEADRCGSCRRCVDACPTDAFPAPHELDARRCIAYLTIEHRGAFTPGDGALLDGWVFGCDVCQDVCPWNVRFAKATTDPELAPRPELAHPSLADLLGADSADLRARFRDTALERAGPEGLKRNARALGEQV